MPKAASLAAEIESKLDVQVKKIESKGGVFDVHANGQLVYSKQEQGDRFPEHAEVLASLESV